MALNAPKDAPKTLSITVDLNDHLYTLFIILTTMPSIYLVLKTSLKSFSEKEIPPPASSLEPNNFLVNNRVHHHIASIVRQR